MSRLRRLLGATLLLAGAFGGAALNSPAAALTIERVPAAGGLEAWLSQDHTLPVVAIRISFPGGASLDPAGKSGLASFAADLLDEGAGPYDNVAFQSRIEELVTDLRFNVDADQLDVSLRTVPTNLDPVADLVKAALQAPRFERSAVERVRGQVLADLSRKAQSPRSISGRLWMQQAFGTQPYGRPTEGVTADVARITEEDLHAFARMRLVRSGVVIGAVGDITPAQLAAFLQTLFGDLPQGEAAATIPEAKPAQDGALLVGRKPVPQSVVTFGQAGPKRDDPDWYAAVLVNDVLGGGGFRGRLMQEVREKRGLAYGISTSLAPYRHGGLILGSVATENGRVAETIALIRQEWARMRDEGPTEAELAAAKSYLTGAFPLSLDSSQRIAALLVQLQTDHLGIDFLDRRAALLEAVTLDQARAVARKLLDPNGLSFAVVGEPANLTPTGPTPELRF